jgi:hypothetical protein
MNNASPVHPRPSNRLFLGIILIFIGVIFLLQQAGRFDLRNWWALFILIPAFGSFTSAWYAFQRSGRINEGVRAGLGGGLIVFTVAMMFLFNLDWSIWWPLMVIVPGLVVVFNGFTLPGSREANRPLSLRIYRPWTGWVGLGILFLGIGFQANNLGVIRPTSILHNWWTLAIFFPAFGGLVTALRLAFEGHPFGWAGTSNLIATIVVAAVGVIAFMGVNWNYLAPVILIAAGLILLTGVFRRRA